MISGTKAAQCRCERSRSHRSGRPERPRRKPHRRLHGPENVEIAYLVDPDSRPSPDALDEVDRKGKYKPKGAADIRHAIADKDVDAITVAAPNHGTADDHLGAQGGKHIYVEKPMSHDVHEGRVAVEAPSTAW